MNDTDKPDSKDEHETLYEKDGYFIRVYKSGVTGFFIALASKTGYVADVFNTSDDAVCRFGQTHDQAIAKLEKRLKSGE